MFRSVLSALIAVSFYITNASGQVHSQVFEEEYTNNTNIHLAVGSTNGARLGAMWYLDRNLGAEASVGWMRLENSDSENNSGSAKTNALAFSLGGNYLTHPDNKITAAVSVFVTYIHATEKLNNLDLHRWAVTASFGSIYHVSTKLLAFFRAGPSVHFLSQSESGQVQAFLQFDGGIGWCL